MIDIQMCEGELQWRWRSHENWKFHFELIKFYKELVESNMSNEDIVLWFLSIPSEYHTWSENSALHIAATLDNEEIVRLLLSLKPDIVNERNACGQTALSIAVRNGNARVAKVLLESQATHESSYYKDDFGPLHVAVRYGYAEIIKMLAEAGADVNAADKLRKRPLHLLVWNAEWERGVDPRCIVEILVEAGADVNLTNAFNETPLLNLAENGYFDLASALLDAGADSAIADFNLRTPLHLTVRRRDVRFARKLIEKGADVNALDGNGWSALCYAVEAGSYEIARLLLQSGAEIDVFGVKNFNPLFHAVRHENCELIDLLMKWKPDADLEVVCEKHTLLQMAALQRRKDVVVQLLSYGAKIGSRSKEGYGVLYYAAKPNNVYLDHASHNELLHFLLAKGAAENLNHEEKVEILENAVTYADEKLVRLLVERVVNLSEYPATKYYKLLCHAIENKYDKSAFKFLANNVKFDINADVDEGGRRSLLHVAARLNNSSVAKYLIKAGCDINRRSGWGRTPLHDAVKHVNPSCVRLLLSYNAEVNGVDYIERNCPLGMAMADLDVERGKEVIFCIARHIAALEAFDVPVDERNHLVIRSNDELSGYYRRCTDELRKMRQRSVCGTTTFFEVFLHPERYSRNLRVIPVLRDDAALGAFAIYGDLLKERFNKVLKRRKLIESAESGLKRILGCEAKSFTLVFDNILQYLSNKDLRHLILV